MQFKKAVLGLVCIVSAVASTGCGDLLSGLNKIASGQICSLSVAEIKALNGAAIQAGAAQTPPLTIPVLTDAQAQAIADFFSLNAICTTADIEALPARIEAGDTILGLDALAAAFGDSGIDPNNVDPTVLTNLLNQILGS
ncbi:MAG: hypothetical protein AABZ08_11540 [Planctomycetota bacterium]